MLAFDCFFLALRSFILAWQPSKPVTTRLIDHLLGIFFVILFLFLPYKEVHWSSHGVVVVLITLSLYRRFSPSLKYKKFSFRSLISIAVTVVAGILLLRDPHLFAWLFSIIFIALGIKGLNYQESI